GTFSSKFMSRMSILHHSSPPFILSLFRTRSVTLPTNFAPHTTRNAHLPVVFAPSPIGCSRPTTVFIVSLHRSARPPICHPVPPVSLLAPRTPPDSFSTATP